VVPKTGEPLNEGQAVSGFVLPDGTVVSDSSEVGHSAIAEMYGVLAKSIPPQKLKPGVTAFWATKIDGEIIVRSTPTFPADVAPITGIVQNHFK